MAHTERASDTSSSTLPVHVSRGERSGSLSETLNADLLGAVRRAAADATGGGIRFTVGPANAASWLSEHGTASGLCRIYDNEPWHYDLRPEAIAHGCPAPYPDPTHDPRMQR